MSSASGRRPAPGRLPEASLADLEVAWKGREEEARQLVALGYHSTAVSMRFYSFGTSHQDLHWVTREIGLVVENVQDLDEVDRRSPGGEDEVDLTDLLERS